MLVLTQLCSVVAVEELDLSLVWSVSYLDTALELIAQGSAIRPHYYASVKVSEV